MLPQRRKSAEEIAKLRESLGIPDEEAAIESPAADASSADPAKEDAAVAPIPETSETEKPSLPSRKVRSLRKSEQKPVELSRVETKNGIPVRRHDDRELVEIRRIQATPPDQSISYIQHLAAP